MTLNNLFDGSYVLKDRQQLKLGDKGGEVILLKRFLFAHGFGAAAWGDFKHEPSAEFDAEVDGRVHQFQTSAGLTMDGVVGPKTWRRLMKKPSVQVGAAAATGVRAKLLKLLNDPAKQAEYRKRGKQAVKDATGSTSNACATTASQPLIELGLLKKPHFMAQYLADDLEDRCLVTRINAKSQVQPGDLIVCEDFKPKNGLSDHVWWALSIPDAKLMARCLDNNGTELTHPRNLGHGPRTPMAYALRFS
jgi:hypothetical protein